MVYSRTMRTSSYLSIAAAVPFALLFACSSSSNSGSPGSIPTCQGAMPGQSTTQSGACSSCAQSSCGSEVSAFESACSDYLSCFSACQCSDDTCIENCTSKLTEQSCEQAGGNFEACEDQNCASQCGLDDAGGG